MTYTLSNSTAANFPACFLSFGSIHEMAAARTFCVSSMKRYAAVPTAAATTALVNGTLSAKERSMSVPCALDASASLTLLTFLPSCGNATLETTAAKKVAQLKTATTPTSRGTAIGSISVTVEGLRCANIAQMATTTAKY